jgi:mannose-1-phosphate guanylyltransferase
MARTLEGFDVPSRLSKICEGGMQLDSDVFGIIMAGGIGSRFWPVSRVSCPKQFLDLLGTGSTLIQDTYRRLSEVVPAENILVVTHQQYVGLVREQLPELEAANILAEPMGRNTAPCIALGTQYIAARNPNARIIATPADHLIVNERLFWRDLRTGLSVIGQQDAIVTLGIHPTRADTGYGYIQYLEDNPIETGCYRVKTFTEKPTLEVAKSFVSSGEFLWNSGLFLFRAPIMLQAIAEYLPEVHELFVGVASAIGTPGEAEAVQQAYVASKNVSIDIGVMEKASNVFVIRSTFGWSDLGTWASLHKQLDRDTNGNAVLGSARFYEAKGNMVRSAEGKLVVIKGLKNLIVVDMDDVLLICKRSEEQGIREVTTDLRTADETQRFL